MPCAGYCRPVAKVWAKRKGTEHHITLTNPGRSKYTPPTSLPPLPRFVGIKPLERSPTGSRGLVKVSVAGKLVCQQPAEWRMLCLLPSKLRLCGERKFF